MSFWFAPALMALLAVLLAWFMYWLDSQLPNEGLQSSRFVLAGTAAELRSGMLAIASTVLATAGIVFTLLTLPLSTVAAQYGSRLLRLFLGDRTTQLVLGMFVGTFVYSLAAALSIPPVAVEPEGPQLTATLAVYLMLATFASLILLVQHISIMLQAPNIAAVAGAELQDVIRAEMAADIADASGISEPSQARSNSYLILEGLTASQGYELCARSTGYIQYVDTEIVLALAQEYDLVLRILHKTGHYVWPGAVLAVVWPAARVDSQLDKLLRRTIQIGNGRTPTQDVGYAVNQLTEMAVRAMSPAINDPFTAMTCLDHLGTGLAQFVQQDEEGYVYDDQKGKARLILEPVSFKELLGNAFDMLRHASCDNASVLLRMMDTVARIGQETTMSDARELLLGQVELLVAESEVGNLIQPDRQRIRLRAEALRISLENTPGAICDADWGSGEHHMT